ncbi:MAG: ABC transporter permease [Acutalibacter sp.]|jgi:putative aldouronate transport system permease protein
MKSPAATTKTAKPRSKLYTFIRQRRIDRNWPLYVMLIPVVVYFALFCYAPMYGITLAFKDYKVRAGIMGSPWADPWYTYFQEYFQSPYFGRVVPNTIIISLQSLIFCFPLPILLALSLNEVRSTGFKKFVQNVTYIPHFLSVLVLVGMLKSFTNSDYGIVNLVINAMGGEGKNWMQEASLFRPLYVGSAVWQNMGWDAIIYIAALAGIDPGLHEAAMIDGANRLQRIWHINIPGILPTMVILLILNAGNIMNVGFEKIFLMQNDLNMNVSDVISTYAYRIGIESAQYSLSTTISLFNSVINCILLFIVNGIARKLSDTSLW